jgi:ATP-dependent RNA helicase DeaD
VCVATDVAARGIDLPSVSLVIHVDLPRDAEALQHRSGRTGRAGRKGTAVLLVPFHRRKRVEMMLRGAKIDTKWMSPPEPAEILAKDRERMLAALTAPAEIDEDDRELVSQVMAKLPPEAIAAALVRSLRTDLPAPEDILGHTPRGEAGSREPGPRPGFEDSTWFRINAGRRHNADPRWLLPVICRYGHVTRGDIGAIRIAANESYFQVTGRATRDFVKALRKATILPEDEGMMIEAAEPRDAAAAARPIGPSRHKGPRKPDGPNKRPPRR